MALPATMPYILAGIRLAVGKALVGAIVAELFLASQGLGYFVQNQTSNFDMDAAFAGIVLLAAAALHPQLGRRPRRTALHTLGR